MLDRISLSAPTILGDIVSFITAAGIGVMFGVCVVKFDHSDLAGMAFFLAWFLFAALRHLFVTRLISVNADRSVLTATNCYLRYWGRTEAGYPVREIVSMHVSAGDTPVHLAIRLRDGREFSIAEGGLEPMRTLARNLATSLGAMPTTTGGWLFRTA